MRATEEEKQARHAVMGGRFRAGRAGCECKSGLRFSPHQGAFLSARQWRVLSFIKRNLRRVKTSVSESKYLASSTSPRSYGDFCVGAPSAHAHAHANDPECFGRRLARSRVWAGAPPARPPRARRSAPTPRPALRGFKNRSIGKVGVPENYGQIDGVGTKFLGTPANHRRYDTTRASGIPSSLAFCSSVASALRSALCMHSSRTPPPPPRPIVQQELYVNPKLRAAPGETPRVPRRVRRGRRRALPVPGGCAFVHHQPRHRLRVVGVQGLGKARSPE